MWPHIQQPTRPLHPWHSPGKNIGVGCYFLLWCMHACWIASVVSDSVLPRRWQPTRLLRPQDSLGKKTGVGCHFLLQLFMLTEAKLHRRYRVLTVIFVCCWSHNEIPQTGWLKQQKLISHSSRSLKSKIKLLADLISPEASFLCLQMAVFLLCSYTIFSLWVCAPVVSSTYEKTGLIRAHPKDFV